MTTLETPIESFEDLPAAMAATIAQQGWPIIGKIDVKAGCGVLVGGESKCVWSVDGRRITVTYGAGTLIVAESRDVDPVYAERKPAKKAAK